MPKKESGGEKKYEFFDVKGDTVKVKDKDGNVIVFKKQKDGFFRKPGWKVKDGVAVKKKLKIVPKPKPKHYKLKIKKKTMAEINAMVARNNAKIVKDNFGSFFVNQEEDITKAKVSDFFGEIEGKGIAEKMAKTANKLDESMPKPLMKTGRHGTILSGASGFSGANPFPKRPPTPPPASAKPKLKSKKGKEPAKQQTDYSDVETAPTQSQLYYEEQLDDFYNSVNRADFLPRGDFRMSVNDKMKHLSLADKPRAINQPKPLEKQVIPKLIPKETYESSGYSKRELKEDLRERHKRAKWAVEIKGRKIYPPQDTYEADPTSKAVNPVEYTRKPRPKAKSKPKPTSAEGATPEALPKPKGRMKEGSRRYNELHGIKNPKRVRTDYVKKDPKDYKKMGRPRKTEVLPIPKEVPLYLTADKFRDPFKGKLARGGNIKFKFDPKTKQYLNKNYKLGFGEYGSVKAFKKDEKIDIEYQFHKVWYKENVEKYYN